jgi:hypothetical protein
MRAARRERMGFMVGFCLFLDRDLLMAQRYEKKMNYGEKKMPLITSKICSGGSV